MSIFANKKHNNENAYVNVLGTGCPKCRALAENAEQALAQVGREPIVEHIEDVKKIAAYGVMSTPALVIGNEVVASGTVLSPEKIVECLKKAKGEQL